MSELRPAMLTDRGLIPTLQRYIADFNRFFGRHVILDSEPLTVRLSEDQQLALFRIVQESLQNIQKHAGTQNARVTIRQYEGDVILEIVDEGRGFDSDRTGGSGSGGGAGLPGMRERARLIGARLSVASAPGAGVTVRLVLPVIYGTGPAQAPARDEENAR
jgi:signal transduction histidine kinase